MCLATFSESTLTRQPIIYGQHTDKIASYDFIFSPLLRKKSQHHSNKTETQGHKPFRDILPTRSQRKQHSNF